MNNKSFPRVFLAVVLVCGLLLVSVVSYGTAQSGASGASLFRISGYILDSEGNGIAGARIIFNVPDIVSSVDSASSGYYSISAPAGTYHVNVWPPFDSNYIYYDEAGFVVESDISKNITLASGYKVSGYITNSDGTPIVKAAVSLGDYVSGWYSKYSGYYFVTVPAGTYTLTARPANGPKDVSFFSPYYEYNVVVSGNLEKNIIVGVTSPSPSPLNDSDSWPMFHNDAAHSGYSESTGPLTNQLLWKHKADSGVESSPAVVDGVVYFGALWNGSNGFVNALNATTGSRIWQFATDSGVESSPAVVGGVVYIGSYGGNVYALDAASGSQLWSFDTGGSVFPSPAVVNGVVYVGSATGYMYALNAANGSPLWSYRTGGAIFSSPAVVDGVVYFGSQDQNLYALSASDGSQVWSFATGDYIDTSPVVVNGVVYFGSRDGYVYALNATNGVQIWSFRALHGNYGSYYYSTPAVADGVIYVGSYDRYIYALNAANGDLIWESPTGGYVFASPVVAGGVVYVGSFDGKVYALNAITGGKIWSYQTGDQMRSSCAVVNGIAYVGSGDGYLYAFGSLNPQPTTSYNISGYVLDENGNGIEGAHITFNAPPIPSVTSDSSGYYVVSAPAGTYRVNVWPPFDSSYINYDELSFVVESDMTKNITLYSGYKVSGYITNSSGNPVVGAAVLLDNYGSGWFSNSSGYYFLNVPSGTYTITARPRTGDYYSGTTTDFPTYHEYNFTVDADTVKNITVGSQPPTSTPNPAPIPYAESSSETSYALPPELGSSPEQASPLDTVTPEQPAKSTSTSNVTLLGIILGILIVATPIAGFISGCLLYFKKRNR